MNMSSLETTTYTSNLDSYSYLHNHAHHNYKVHYNWQSLKCCASEGQEREQYKERVKLRQIDYPQRFDIDSRSEFNR